VCIGLISYFPGVFIDSPTDFIVQGIEDGRKLACVVVSPSGVKTEGPVSPGPNGTHKILYTPVEEGKHQIELVYDQVPIPGSPFPVHVQRGSDPSKVKVRAN
jgi:hypothetical protein